MAAIGQGDNFGYNVTHRSCTRPTVITVIPMVLVFLLVQPAFVRGLTGSGVEWSDLASHARAIDRE